MAKRRKKGEGSVRQRKDGRWEGRVVIGYDGGEGRRAGRARKPTFRTAKP